MSPINIMEVLKMMFLLLLISVVISVHGMT